MTECALLNAQDMLLCAAFRDAFKQGKLYRKSPANLPIEACTMSILRTIAVLGIVLFAGTSLAQEYPNRPIRLVVPSSPGGAPDVLGRALAEKLTVALGQPIVIDNRTGAAGNIGGEMVAKAAPDGYTLLLGWDGMIVINPHLYSKMPYDTMKDLVPLATVSSTDMVLAVHPSVPAKTFPEFIEYAKKTKPALPYASIGNGSQHHLTMEMLKVRAGIDLLHIPYKGGTPAATATVAGDTLVLFAGSAAKPHFKSGRLRPLAAANAKRSSYAPELPTISEFYPGFETIGWIALFAPAGTPQPIVTRLRNEVNKLLVTIEMKEKFDRAGGLEPFITTPQEFAAILKSDYAKYGKAVRDFGAKID
jgi:tripartite-type tricarboxylate transporter receptor subunit TctC